MQIIPPRSGTRFLIRAGQTLEITDIMGEQVSDLVCFNQDDHGEYISSSRTLDYSETIFLTTGHLLYSNRSKPMFEIVADDVGRHDFLLTPCSADTFRIIYGHTNPHRGCLGNLAAALAPDNISVDQIPVSFNVFMHVDVDGSTGRLQVLPPSSKAGDKIVLRAMMNMLVGLTACSAEMSNNYSFKPIGYQIL